MYTLFAENTPLFSETAKTVANLLYIRVFDHIGFRTHTSDIPRAQCLFHVFDINKPSCLDSADKTTLGKVPHHNTFDCGKLPATHIRIPIARHMRELKKRDLYIDFLVYNYMK